MGDEVTFSILAFDDETGRIGGAAATGNLCVGGWVLRAGSLAGASASQGAYPSTLWGEEALRMMRNGKTATETLGALVSADTGAVHRQLALMDIQGKTAVHTGIENVDAKHAIAENGLVVSGNMLKSVDVIEAIFSTYKASGSQPFEDRLISAIEAGQNAGSDFRGLMSAALKIVGRNSAPYDLRIDYHQAPIKALRDLHERAQSPEYHQWLDRVPTENNPNQPADGEQKIDQ